MSTLFDVSPEEPEKTKRQKKSPKTPDVVTPEFRPALPARAPVAEFLGRADDGDIVCVDETCLGTAHDISADDGRMWLLHCVYCGTGQWVKARRLEKREPGSAEFRLSDGRFAGMTLNEVALQPVGAEFIEWASGNHPRPAVKDACKKWLAAHGDTR